jgi:hypothetical protein
LSLFLEKIMLMTTFKTVLLIGSSACLLGLTGCKTHTETDALVGGGAGATAGALIAGPVGAVVGGAGGAATGALIGNSQDREDENTED